MSGGAGGIGQVKVGKARDFTLAHWDAACDLAEVFAKGDLQDQSLHRAETALVRQATRPSAHLTQGFDIGGEPRQRVGSELVFFQQRGGNAAIGRDARAQGCGRFCLQRLDLRHHGGGEGQKVSERCVGWHPGPIMRHESAPLLQVHRG
ncbi:hypothetical protein GALL_450100 [mine drainage metagenome]|uniref:Uncharacterized protein n=1 Tax=mine drainage metagenome TaxID=410659 RepID=A0A1J5Q0I0_9ZZZZ